jgi:hypothetical protein
MAETEEIHEITTGERIALKEYILLLEKDCVDASKTGNYRLIDFQARINTSFKEDVSAVL